MESDVTQLKIALIWVVIHFSIKTKCPQVYSQSSTRLTYSFVTVSVNQPLSHVNEQLLFNEAQKMVNKKPGAPTSGYIGVTAWGGGSWSVFH